MNSFILADRQDLTRFAIESIIRRDSRNIVYTASDKARQLPGLIFRFPIILRS